MVRPLRKTKLDGTLYRRRSVVEIEIQQLSIISTSELERRASVGHRTEPDFVSPEALVHFVRNAEAGAHRDRLTERLLERIFRLAPRAENADGTTASLTNANIRDDIADHFIDLLLSDRSRYDERLDYYEVSFNSAVANDRKDASERHWRHENRTEEIDVDEDEGSDLLNGPLGGYTPFDPDELDKKNYRLLLDAAIDNLPELQRRIIAMYRQGLPIDSQDPTAVTISKSLGKSEKTIRTHRDKAYASLRLYLERKGKTQ